MAIICSDLHGNLTKTFKFLNYKPDELHIVAGDILDSFRCSPEQQLATLNELIASDCILLWGNHDLHYRTHPPFTCSGYQYSNRAIYNSILEKNRKRFFNAVAIDGYLITHAGVHDRLALHDDLERECKYLNAKYVERINNISVARGGYNKFGGIFWYDYEREQGLSKKYNQVFGHTQSVRPWEEKGEDYHHVCINTYDDHPNFYVFNTSTKLIEELP